MRFFTRIPYFPKPLADEFETLAIKHHAQDILDDLPVMNEADLMGVLNHPHKCNSMSVGAWL